MKFTKTSHRSCVEILENNEKKNQDWIDLRNILNSISDREIIEKFEYLNQNKEKKNKSLSVAINELIDEKLVLGGWLRQANIFNPEDKNHPDPSPKSTRFRLDFAKNDIAVEVAFNHGEAAAWNLMKPVLSSEMNHIEKQCETKYGIIITATDGMKKAGGFDGAVGTYEKYKRYLIAMNTQLTSPLVLIGLEAPKTFYVEHIKGDSKVGVIKELY